MLEDLTAEQYEGWSAWMRKTQPRPDRMDWAWGMLLAMTNNAWADESDRKSAQDYMPYHDRYEEDITAEELVARLGL